MGDPGPGSWSEDAADARERMDALVEALTAGGLHATLHATHGAFDITATLHQPGHRDIDVVIDEDGYVELRYWTDPAASSEQVVTLIFRALAAISTGPLGQFGQPPPEMTGGSVE